ncbi:UDP-2,4-diacetamido-2,4,6-trideoxy-beta-L-altropyranose hydrolase [Deltaproteobacteria bacterium OttesenSCG-928-M10]|nr:UDP-2,4-diacetamido-2,4,6-trideoxy-beta-L-altropyranose hydrolase [Deltaproteobacteria bacterium OttesenSCG-928-M10]
MSRRLLIRADASPSMGTGHVMRCLALALAARQAGHEVLLAGRVEVDWVLERLDHEKVSFHPLPGPIPQAEDPSALLTLVKAQKPNAVVLDGYHFGLDSQKAIRSAGFRLLVIDDYNHLPEYSADILLNQNLGSDDLPYRGDIGQKLLGPGYALLRPEFAAARRLAEQRVWPDKPRRLLLTLGGGDFINHLERLAPDLNLPELAGTTLTVLAGKMAPAKIRAALTGCPAEVEILSGVDDMPGLLLKTDLAISAGGSTCWELCCLGVPFLTVEIAENQQVIVWELASRGVAPAFGPSVLRELLASDELRGRQRERGLKLVSPSGVAEVVAALIG